MATYTLDATGADTTGTTVAVAANATDVTYLLVNDSDSSLTLELTPSANVTVTEGLTHKMGSKSYKLLTVSEGAAGVSETLAVTSILNAHGTGAQSGEKVYLTLA